jgi:hypothetical protein
LEEEEEKGDKNEERLEKEIRKRIYMERNY